MSSVAGNVPFNWTTGQPDDIYNWLVNIAYLYVPGTGYVPDAPPYGDYTISRFEGHLSIMDNSGTPETDNNGHLDLYGLFSLYTTNMPSSVTEEHASDIVFYEDTTNPIIGSYPPSGYDVHGLPLPPIVPGIDLHKNIVIIPDEFPVAISPNPFNSATTIKCCIPKNDYSESVILVIYDRLGKKVYETQKNSDKGFAKFTWNGITQNGEEAPSGVYLYKVICGEYSKTGTICLIR